MPDTREEIVALLALSQVEGINHQLRRILCRFSPVQTALEVPDWNILSGGREFCRIGRAEFSWAEEQWLRLSAAGGALSGLWRCAVSSITDPYFLATPGAFCIESRRF